MCDPNKIGDRWALCEQCSCERGSRFEAYFRGMGLSAFVRVMSSRLRCMAEDLALIGDPRVLRSVERLGTSAAMVVWAESKLRRHGEFDDAPLNAAIDACQEKLRAGCMITPVPQSHLGIIAGAEKEPKGVKSPPGLNKGVQTECVMRSDAATGDSPVETADAGVQTRDDLPEALERKCRKRRRRRRWSGARTSAPASPSTNSSRGTGGGDMAAAGPPQVGGREQRSKRGVRAAAPPRPAAGGPSFAAVAASAGRIRPSTCSAAASGARGGGEDKGRAPADGGVLRGSLSSSPPPPRPEPKRKKGGPPPFAAAANMVKGMRIQGSSIPAKDLRVGGRDVTAEIISAVSLLAKCGRGVVPGIPGRARRSLAPVSPVPERTRVDGRGAGRLRRQG